MLLGFLWEVQSSHAVFRTLRCMFADMQLSKCVVFERMGCVRYLIIQAGRTGFVQIGGNEVERSIDGRRRAQRTADAGAGID